jgi:hypothetical protein
MQTEGQNYLDQLVGPWCNGFDRRFSKISTGLGLGNTLIRNELRLLHEATFCATLCNIALNGLGGCRGKIRPERESNRVNLESEFMAARDTFCASTGWKSLPLFQRGAIQRIFLNVFVTEDKLSR